MFKDKIQTEKLLPFKTLEEWMTKYKRECDERVWMEVESEVNRVRELELSWIWLEESAKYWKMINEFQSELDSMHQEKVKELKLWEHELLSRIKDKERQIESAAFDHR